MVNSVSIGVSIVVPVYCAESRLEKLTKAICYELTNTMPFEIILVDDASPDSSWSKILGISSENASISGLRLAVNAGQHAALLAGIRAAKYNVVVTMDDDFQNPPSEIRKLLDALKSNFEVVYGVSEEINQTMPRKILSKVARKLLAKTMGFDTAMQMSSFRAFRTGLRDAFDNEIGPSISIDALLTWSTTRFTTVDVEHHARVDGKSNYTLRKLTKFMISTITNYSIIPLKISLLFGALISVFGFLLFVWVMGNRIIFGDSVPGFPLLAASITIFSGAQLLILGIIGEYIGNIHFRTMKKPTYVIAQVTNKQSE